MSLRARLLLATLAVVLLGLLAADVATYSALRSFLYKRVDVQLDGAHRSVEGALLGRGGPFADQTLRQLGDVVPGVYVQVRGRDDAALFTAEGRGRDEPVFAPKLPARVLPLVADRVGRGSDDARILTVGAVQPRGPRYRVSVSPLLDQGALVVALPLADTDATLQRLLGIEILVTIGVLLAASAAALWLVRVGLRPLAAIETTAAEITGGDLTHRVERDDEHTEVGRVGRAINVMLGRIDVAFAERTASEEKARASEERMRRFVGDASHELRTPVAAVRAYAELYRMGADRHPEDLARLLRRIEDEAARMGVLVDDLLLLTRLDEGRPLERATVDLGAVAADAVTAARALEPERRIELDVVGSVEVTGDRARLRQVVDNLLANVRSHTPPDAAARVRVADDGDVSVLEVSDDGPGIDSEQASHLFERFYRVEGSRSRDNGGAGLGLSIVAAIMAAHGGTATLRASDGGGATFRVELPRLRPEPDA